MLLLPPQRAALFGTVPAWVLQQYALAGAVPDVALDLQVGRAYAKGIYNGPLSGFLTVANASGGYVDDLNGNWTLKPANTLRQSNKYTLFEEARTNSIRNNSSQGAVAGSPGTLPTNWTTSLTSGLSASVVSTGIQNGVDYIDIRVQGTPASATQTSSINFEAPTQIVAVQAQTWAGSAFIALQAGTLTNITSVSIVGRERNAGGTSLQADVYQSITPTATFTRYGGATATAQATTAFIQPQLNLINTDNTTAIDVTFRIGWPQLELGASVTSPIRTTSAAATRNADVASISGLVFGPQFTVFGQGVPQAPVGYAVNQCLMLVGDGTNNNRAQIYRTGTTELGGAFMSSGGVTQATRTGAAISQNSTAKLAMALAAGDQHGVLNGTLMTADTGASMPVNPSQLKIGNINGAAFFNGGVQRAAVWSASRLPNAALQAITQ